MRAWREDTRGAHQLRGGAEQSAAGLLGTLVEQTCMWAWPAAAPGSLRSKQTDEETYEQNKQAHAFLRRQAGGTGTCAHGRKRNAPACRG